MYKVLGKDIIEKEILPHLSVAKRGFKTKSCLIEVVNSILYKLKTGVQWHMLPVYSLFSNVVLSYKTVFWHFRKWCKKGDWQIGWINILSKHKGELDLSSGDIDGSHSPTLRGGQEVAYQGRKKRKTTNSLYLTDRQGIPLSMSTPIAGNHHDLYKIEDTLKDLFSTMQMAKISLDGLFINADSGFDSKEFRDTCDKYGIFANVDFNARNGNIDNDYLFDELLYEQIYTIERTNAWMDSYRTLLNRFDTTISSWKSFNYIEHISGWLYSVARNQITDWWRKKKNEPLFDYKDDNNTHFTELSEVLFEQAPSPETEYLRSLVWFELEKALAELPIEQRDAFEMTEMQGLSFKQIAEQTGVPVNTLISRKRSTQCCICELVWTICISNYYRVSWYLIIWHEGKVRAAYLIFISPVKM